MVSIEKGEVRIICVFTDAPVDGEPAGEPVTTEFVYFDGEELMFLNEVPEPYAVDWLDWKKMHVIGETETVVKYGGEMNCVMRKDFLDMEEPPETLFAGQGRVRKIGFGDSAGEDEGYPR